MFSSRLRRLAWFVLVPSIAATAASTRAGTDRVELPTIGLYGTLSGDKRTQFVDARAFCEDSAGRIWVADSGEGRIVRLGADGEFLGVYRPGKGTLQPKDVVCTTAGAWVLDRVSASLVLIDHEMREVRRMPLGIRASRVDACPDGSLLVAALPWQVSDPDGGIVRHFSPGGELLGSWVRPDSARDAGSPIFNDIASACGADDAVSVWRYGHAKIERWSLTGDLRSAWEGPAFKPWEGPPPEIPGLSESEKARLLEWASTSNDADGPDPGATDLTLDPSGRVLLLSGWESVDPVTTSVIQRRTVFRYDPSGKLDGVFGLPALARRIRSSGGGSRLLVLEDSGRIRRLALPGAERESRPAPLADRVAERPGLGELPRLTSLSGQPVGPRLEPKGTAWLLVFFEPECDHCWQLLRSADRFLSAHREIPVRLLGLAARSEISLARFKLRAGVQCDLAVDPDDRWHSRYGSNAIVLDPEGKSLFATPSAAPPETKERMLEGFLRTLVQPTTASAEPSK